MDANRIGLVIRTLRKKVGLTQQQLAEKLQITDKAVSKWERGLGVPDISMINQLAIILNIDVDNLLAGNLAYLENEWVGELRLDKFEGKISIKTEVYGKPSVYLYLCYFALAGIKNIYISCSMKERIEIEENLSIDERYGLNIYYNEHPIYKNAMIIYGPVFIYGPNLTKYFQRGMMHSNALTKLIVPHKGESLIYINGKNQVSDMSYMEQGYKPIPISFFNGTNKKVEYEPLGRGMISIELKTIDDVLNVANLIQVIEKYNGDKVYCLEEIVFRRGFINSKQLQDIAQGDIYLLGMNPVM